MSATLRCAADADHHRGAVLMIEIVLEIRVPGQPSDVAPIRMPACESCIENSKAHFAQLRSAFGGAS